MRVVILDPSHASEAGHHQELNNALIHGLSGAGHQPEVWVDRALQQAPPYWPGSDAMGYIDPRHWSDLGGCLHLAAKLRQQWHQAQPLQTTASAGPVGCWLAHSLLPFQQIAMAQLLQQQRSALVILSLMFPPGERLGGSTADANARCHEHMWLCATAAHQALAQACRQAGHQLLVGSGSAQTLSQHQALWQAAKMHELHWHPAVVGASGAHASSSDDAPSLPTVLLHWGDGKADKGRKEALAVLQALMQRPAAQRPQWQLLFHLHSSQALPEEDEQLLGQAQASLGGQLQLLRERVSTAKMQLLLARCSLALLAYDPIAYAQRSSGVLWCYAAARYNSGQSAAALGYGGHWLQAEAEALGMAWHTAPVVVTPGDGELWLRAIKEALSQRAAPVPWSAQAKRVLGQSFSSWVVEQLQQGRR